MQKHERQCLKIAKEILEPNGLKITLANSGTTNGKKVIWAEGPGVRDRKTLSSSPKDIRHEVDHTKQWARRLIARLG